MALSGMSGIPYDAADYLNPHMAAWNPYLPSPDFEINPYRDRLIARVRDLVRNDGWASGAVSRILDNTIGHTFRPISKPDYRALAAYTGKKTFDATWADEFSREVNAHWRAWAEDPGFYCDMHRSMPLNELLGVAFRHKLVDGDALCQMVFLEDRVGYGKARYATAVNLIDPDRLSNPQLRFDTATMRGGVELDQHGAAKGYHIRQAHQGDWFVAYKSITWDYIPRETSWGRPIIVHDYDRTRASEHRGAGGIFAPILDRLRMLAKYDRTELDAAIINATFAAFIKSPMDRQLVEEAIGDEFEMNNYQERRREFHEDRRTAIGEARMLTLFPGEEVETVEAARPNGNFGDFQATFIRYCASALGITEQQFSQNWNSVNFSSARAALLEIWKTTTRRRFFFGMKFGLPIRVSWMEELFEMHMLRQMTLPLPAGAPDFVECRQAYSACKWAGPGRGYPDPVADREGSVLAMTSGLSTLEDEVMDGSGGDWEDNLEKNAIIKAKYDELGLPYPEWLGASAAGGQPNRGGNHDPNSPNYRSGKKEEKK